MKSIFTLAMLLCCLDASVTALHCYPDYCQKSVIFMLMFFLFYLVFFGPVFTRFSTTYWISLFDESLVQRHGVFRNVCEYLHIFEGDKFIFSLYRQTWPLRLVSSVYWQIFNKVEVQNFPYLRNRVLTYEAATGNDVFVLLECSALTFQGSSHEQPKEDTAEFLLRAYVYKFSEGSVTAFNLTVTDANFHSKN